MTFVTDGRNLESVLDLTLANTNILPALKVLFPLMINVQTGMTGVNGLVTRGVRGACSNEDVETVLHQGLANLRRIPRRSA